MLCSLLFILNAVALGEPLPPTSKATPPIAADRGGLLTAADRRVRTMDKRIQSLLVQGIQRSSTFASLLAALNRTDVIVYIEPVSHLPATLSGRLLLLPIAGEQRYLRIQVAQASSNDLIATIAHELQHALEIADARDVRDQGALARLYEQIGKAGAGPHTYDTTAAQTTGRVVRQELAG